MYQSSTFQRRIFLSIGGDSGKQAANALIDQWVKAGYGSSLDFWSYERNSTQGERLAGEYLNQINNSHFYVPVLTTEFTDSNSIHIKRELETAMAVEEELHKMRSNYKFIVPYFPNGTIDNARIHPELRAHVGADAAGTVESLHNAILASEGLEKFLKHPRSLDDWPDLFFDNGVPDTMFILGHTEKESPLIPHRVESFIRWGLTDRDLGCDGITQSLRPAQMVPDLQRYLYNILLSQHSGKITSLPILPCEIDRHLINYRYDLLGKYNLICLGAGDTNWISRAVQRYYRNALLGVRFGKPDQSQSIVVDTQSQQEFVINTKYHEGKPGKLGVDEVTSRAELSFKIQQIASDKARFSALIIALPNPWNPEKTLILCAGLTGLGTTAAMYALMHPQFKERIKKRYFSHVVVISGKEKDWLPTDYDVLL